jgi:hypothetical protein
MIGGKGGGGGGGGGHAAAKAAPRSRTHARDPSQMPRHMAGPHHSIWHSFKDAIAYMVSKYLIAVLFLILVLAACMLFFRTYPKIPRISHTSPYDVFLPVFYDDLNSYLLKAQSIHAKMTAMTDTYLPLATRKVFADIASLDVSYKYLDRIKMYYEYWDNINGKDWMAGDIPNNSAFVGLCKEGTCTADTAFDTYKTETFDKLNAISDDLTSMTGRPEACYVRLNAGEFEALAALKSSDVEKTVNDIGVGVYESAVPKDVEKLISDNMSNGQFPAIKALVQNKDAAHESWLFIQHHLAHMTTFASYDAICDEYFADCIVVAMLKLLLTKYHMQIKLACASRRKNRRVGEWTFDVLYYYGQENFDTLIKEKAFEQNFRQIPSHFVPHVKYFVEIIWSVSLLRFLQAQPGRLIADISAKLNKKGDGSMATPTGGGGGAGVVEHFDIGDLFDIIPTIVNVIIQVGQLVYYLALLIGMFFSDPVGTVFTFLMIIIQLTMLVVILTLYYIFTALVFPPYVFAGFYALAHVFRYIFEGILFALIWFLVNIVLFVLTLIDYFTHGTVFKMMRCENLPNAWATGNGYHLGNKYNRCITCNTPCAKGYGSSGGCCKKQPNYASDFCPQQGIYLLAKLEQVHLKAPKHCDMHTFVPDQSFRLKTRERKQALIEDIFWAKKAFMKDCRFGLRGFKFVVDSVCLGVKGLAVDAETRKKIEEYCRICECDTTLECQAQALVPEDEEAPDAMFFLKQIAFVILAILVIVGVSISVMTLKAFVPLPVPVPMPVPVPVPMHMPINQMLV